MRFRPHHNLAVADCATNPLLRALLHFTAHLLHNRNRAATVLQAVPPSPCVVGYQNANLVANGQMKASPFVTIGSTGVYLSDLKVTGEPIADNDGCWGDVSIAMLTGTGFNQKVGGMVKTYFWFEEDGEYEAGWYDQAENPLKDDESALGNADEILFEQGEGIWINVKSGYAGCSIDYKGGVLPASFAYPLVVNGQMVGNPHPARVALADMSVSGEPIEEAEGCWGDVSIAMLTGTGFNQKVGGMVKTYYWFEEDGEYEAGWYDQAENPLKDDESTLGNADEIFFESGEAIWVNVKSGYAGCTLNFPAVSID